MTLNPLYKKFARNLDENTTLKLEPEEKYKKLKKYDDVNNLAGIVVAVVFETLFDFPFCSGCHRQNTISFTAF